MPDFEYRYLGDTDKIFTTRREDEKLVKPGELVTSDVPLHHGDLEPLSEPAMDYAEANELAMARDGGEPWLRPEKLAAKKAAEEAERKATEKAAKKSSKSDPAADAAQKEV